MNDDDLPRRPALRPYLREITQDEGSVTFRGGAAAVRLHGRSVTDLLPDLLPRLDGTRTTAELEGELPHVDPDVLRGALRVLHEQHLLGESDAYVGDAAVEGDDLYWESFPDGRTMAARLAEATVLVGGGGHLASEVAAILQRSRVGVAPGGDAHSFSSLMLDGNDVGVWCADSPDEDELREVNLSAARSGTPWLAATLGADHATVGPFVLPGQSACHECFRLRLLSNRSMLDDALGVPVTRSQPPSALPTCFVTLVAATAASEVVRRLSGLARPTSVGAFLSLTPAEALATRHEVLKLPRCPVCGPIRYRPQMKIWELTRDEDTARQEPS